MLHSDSTSGDRALDKIKNFVRAEYERNQVLTTFIILMSVAAFVFLIIGLLTGGKTIWGMLYPGDVFMDYYNSVMYSLDDPYGQQYKVIYPPFATAFYWLIGKITVPFIDPTVEGFGTFTDEPLSFVLRSSDVGLMSYLIVAVLTLFLLRTMIDANIQDKAGVWRARIIAALLLASTPFLYALQRGNCIILAVALILVFLYGYRSENRMLQLLSIVSLGCAAGLKLYPALFAMLLIRDRRWGDTLICAVIGAIITVGPILITGGDIGSWIGNMFSYSNSSSGGEGIVNLQDIVYNLIPAGAARGIISILVIAAFTIASIVIVIFDKDMAYWKLMMLLAGNLMLGPGIGSFYMTTYLLIPLVYFLKSETILNRTNLVFTICFVIVFGLIPTLLDYISALMTIRTIFLLIIVLYLMYEGAKHLTKRYGETHMTEPCT